MKKTLGVALIVLVAASCGGGDPSSADAGPNDQCGPGPYTDYAALPIIRQSSTMVSGVAVSVDACPGVDVVEDPPGNYSFAMTTGEPFTLRFDHPDYLPLVAGERSITATNVGLVLFPLFPTGDTTSGLLPGFDATHAYVVGDLFGAASTSAPCDSFDGVIVTVPDHPEATVHYLSGDPPMDDPSLTATGPMGFFMISGLASGTLEPGDVVATKAGCTLSPPGPETGRLQLAAGTLSLLDLQLAAQ